jgi:hypothetical protein
MYQHSACATSATFHAPSTFCVAHPVPRFAHSWWVKKGLSEVYSDEIVANHNAKVWHGATEHGP